MKQLGMLLLAIGLGVAAWWWYTNEMPRRERERAAAAEAAAMAEAEHASSLYRWRDAEGNLQITDEPPKGRQYERISREPKDGLEVDGSRE